jgi:hypothetical protein
MSSKERLDIVEFDLVTAYEVDVQDVQLIIFFDEACTTRGLRCITQSLVHHNNLLCCGRRLPGDSNKFCEISCELDV